MRAPRPTIIALAALTIGIVVLMVTLTPPIHRYHARSRFKVDTKETHRAPDLSGADANAFRLLLDSRQGHQALAKVTMADERDFALRKIGPVRGTGLGCLEYSGVSSNLVERVASNAARIVVRFYATNQPDWEVTYIDSYCFIPPSLGERLQRIFGF
jgi:hypothetical protein